MARYTRVGDYNISLVLCVYRVGCTEGLVLTLEKFEKAPSGYYKTSKSSSHLQANVISNVISRWTSRCLMAFLTRAHPYMSYKGWLECVLQKVRQSCSTLISFHIELPLIHFCRVSIVPHHLEIHFLPPYVDHSIKCVVDICIVIDLNPFIRMLIGNFTSLLRNRAKGNANLTPLQESQSSLSGSAIGISVDMMSSIWS